MFLFAGASSALAREGGDKKAPRKPRIVGTVAVTKEKKDDKEEITAITLTVARKTESIVYNVVLDEKGKGLAELDGKRAAVVGTVAEADGKKQLTVESFEESKPRPPKKAQ